MQIFEQHCRAGSPVYQTANPAHAGLQILLVGPSNPGWNRAVAHVEEGPKQEFAAGMATVLRVSFDGVAVPDELYWFTQNKVCDRADSGTGAG